MPDVSQLTTMERAGGQYADGRQRCITCCTSAGAIAWPACCRENIWSTMTAISAITSIRRSTAGCRLTTTASRSPGSTAPKAQLMALIIDGIFSGELPWALVLIGALIAVVLELSGVPSLPFAVGVYMPITASVPIFFGGAIRWLVDRCERPLGGRIGKQPRHPVFFGLYCRRHVGRGAGRRDAGLFADGVGAKKLQLDQYMRQGWNESPWPALVDFCRADAVFAAGRVGQAAAARTAERRILERDDRSSRADQNVCDR